jgi:hypothetical protein
MDVQRIPSCSVETDEILRVINDNEKLNNLLAIENEPVTA